MSTTIVKKIKRTPAEQTTNKQLIAQSKARAKHWSERRKTRLTTPTPQPTKTVQEAIPITAATPTTAHTVSPTRHRISDLVICS